MEIKKRTYYTRFRNSWSNIYIIEYLSPYACEISLFRLAIYRFFHRYVRGRQQ